VNQRVVVFAGRRDEPRKGPSAGLFGEAGASVLCPFTGQHQCGSPEKGLGKVSSSELFIARDRYGGLD